MSHAACTADACTRRRYANDKRCLESTQRLRDAYPDVPVFVRARTAAEAEPLLKAGATEVIVEAVEAAARFAALLRVDQDAADSLLRRARMCAAPPLGVPSCMAHHTRRTHARACAHDDAPARVCRSLSVADATPLSDPVAVERITGSFLLDDASADATATLPPFPKADLDELAAECGITYAQVCQLYNGFAELEPNDEGEVELATIRDMLVRMSVTPIDDEALQVSAPNRPASLPHPAISPTPAHISLAVADEAMQAWMGEADSDGSSSLSFFEYVRVDTRLSDQGPKMGW